MKCKQSKSRVLAKARAKTLRDNERENTNGHVNGSKNFNGFVQKSEFEKLVCLELPKTVRFEEPILETHETPQMCRTGSSSIDTPWFNDVWIFHEWNEDWSSVG